MASTKKAETNAPGETPGKKPDFKGEGVAVWVNTDKNGNDYLSIKLVGHEKVIAFKNL